LITHAPLPTNPILNSKPPLFYHSSFACRSSFHFQSCKQKSVRPPLEHKLQKCEIIYTCTSICRSV
jgi:hypothetical protein